MVIVKILNFFFFSYAGTELVDSSLSMTKNDEYNGGVQTFETKIIIAFQREKIVHLEEHPPI